jgi:hypothetical protein
VTIGYLDATALITILSPGPAGDRGGAIWSAFDAACTHQITEIEVPSLIGRQLNRVAWVWALHSLSTILANEEVHAKAIDLAWLGAPLGTALHVAAAELACVDHFLTSDPIGESWASLRGLDVIFL